MKGTSNGMTILDIIRESVEHKSDHLAYRFLSGTDQQTTITYEELWSQTVRLAAHIREKASFSQRAVLLLPSGKEYLLAMFACFHQGIIAVPLYPPGRGRRKSNSTC